MCNIFCFYPRINQNIISSIKAWISIDKHVNNDDIPIICLIDQWFAQGPHWDRGYVRGAGVGSVSKASWGPQRDVHVLSLVLIIPGPTTADHVYKPQKRIIIAIIIRYSRTGRTFVSSPYNTTHENLRGHVCRLRHIFYIVILDTFIRGILKFYFIFNFIIKIF